MNSYILIVFLLTFRVFCNDTRCTLILLSPKYSMATYFDPYRQSNVDYTNVKKVLDDVLPGYVKSRGTFPGLFVSTASTCSPTIRRSAASSSCLAVRRVPTTSSITCGRSYATIINFCYRVDSKIWPRACPVGVCGNHPSRCPSYRGAVLPQKSTVQ